MSDDRLPDAGRAAGGAGEPPASPPWWGSVAPGSPDAALTEPLPGLGADGPAPSASPWTVSPWTASPWASAPPASETHGELTPRVGERPAPHRPDEHPTEVLDLADPPTAELPAPLPVAPAQPTAVLPSLPGPHPGWTANPAPPPHGPAAPAEGVGPSAPSGVPGRPGTELAVPAPYGVPARPGTELAVPAPYDPTGCAPGTTAGPSAVAPWEPQRVPVYGLTTEAPSVGAPPPPLPPHAPTGPSGGARARRPGTVPVWLWVACGAFVLLVVGVVVAELVARATLDDRVAALAAAIELEDDAGEEVSGDFTGEIVDGGSALLTVLGGTIDHVRLTSAEQDLDGADVSTVFDLHGVPVGFDGPAERTDVSIAIDPAALLALVPVEQLELDSDDDLQVESVELDSDVVHVVVDAGTTLTLEVDLVLEADGDELVIGVEDFVMSIDGYDVEFGDLEEETVEVCADSAGLDGDLTAVETADGRIVFTLEVTGASPTGAGLGKAWSCV